MLYWQQPSRRPDNRADQGRGHRRLEEEELPEREDVGDGEVEEGRAGNRDAEREQVDRAKKTVPQRVLHLGSFRFSDESNQRSFANAENHCCRVTDLHNPF